MTPRGKEPTKNQITAKLEAIARPKPSRMTKRELTGHLSKILKRVEDALFLRKVENAKAGRDEGDDDIYAALDIAETMLLQLGAMTRTRERTIPED